MLGQRPVVVLRFDSEGFRCLEGSLRLAALKVGTGLSQALSIRRFDTQGFGLAAQGIELALAGPARGGECLQLLASETQRHGRWIDPLGEDAELPDKKRIARHCPAARLGQLRAFAVERFSRTSLMAGGVTIDLEAGEIEAGQQTRTFHRAILSGPHSAWRRMMEQARLLASLAPCDLLMGEGDLALEAAEGAVLRAKKARKLGLRNDMEIGDAFRLIVRLGIQQISANRRIVLMPEGDRVEGVHQMRVGLRRLRSAVGLFAPFMKETLAEKAKTHLKELADVLGPVRDADVFMEEILDPVLDRSPANVGLGHLKAALDLERASLFAKALEALGARSFEGHMLWLLNWSEFGIPAAGSELKDFSRTALDKRHRKMMKAGRNFLSLTSAERHQLRIRGKKMRYAGEFLQGLFSEAKARRYLDALAHLVDLLGYLNDIAVARTRLDARRDQSSDHALQHAVGLVEGWHAGRAAQLEEDVRTAWAEFSSLEKFWT